MSSWHEGELRFGHYRYKDQLEVDLVLERRDEVWGVKVKAAATVAA